MFYSELEKEKNAKFLGIAKAYLYDFNFKDIENEARENGKLEIETINSIIANYFHQKNKIAYKEPKIHWFDRFSIFIINKIVKYFSLIGKALLIFLMVKMLLLSIVYISTNSEEEIKSDIYTFTSSIDESKIISNDTLNYYPIEKIDLDEYNMPDQAEK